jgi:hypothetical protein
MISFVAVIWKKKAARKRKVYSKNNLGDEVSLFSVCGKGVEIKVTMPNGHP